MPDRFSDHAQSLESPASDGFTIVPSDSVPLPSVTRAIYVGGSGTMVATLSSGAIVTFSGLVAGTLLPVRIQQVRATGTTAANLVGLI